MGSKHVEDNNVTNILLTNKENCALKLVDEIILYYDARLKKLQNENALLIYIPNTSRAEALSPHTDLRMSIGVS